MESFITLYLDDHRELQININKHINVTGKPEASILLYQGDETELRITASFRRIIEVIDTLQVAGEANFAAYR